MNRYILQVSAYCGPTGGNYIDTMLLLQEKMCEKGWCTIYALCENVKLYPWAKSLEEKAKVYYLPVEKARVRRKTYSILSSIFREYPIDIVHSHFELYDIPVIAVSPRNCKVFWHLHDPIAIGYESLSLSRKILMKLQYQVLGKSVQLITCSERHGMFAVNLGFDIHRMHYIPNGLSLKRINILPESKRANEFLIFSWDFYRKGGDLAVAAGERLWNENQYFKVRFVPENVPCDSPFVIKQHPVEDVSELFANSGCFLHISRGEGLSYALLEAIYAGIPVICSDIPENMPVAECPTVYYIRNENVDDLYMQMRKMIESGFKVSSNNIKMSREIITEKFSLESWCEQILQVYSLDI